MPADIDMQRVRTIREPWTAMATAFTAGAAVFGAIGAVLGYLVAHLR